MAHNSKLETLGSKLSRISLWVFLGLLAYMPLHIFLSTWIGTSFGVLEAAKILKDIVLVAGFALALMVSIRQPWFRSLVRDKLIWLVVAYAALTLLVALIKPTDQDAEVLGVVYNLRFLLVFLYAILLSRLFPGARLRQTATKIVLAVAVPVLVFGILQYVLLPTNALEHVGYSRANGVLPAFFIDDKPDLERVMSSLRDPNSFGSYVVIIMSLALTYVLLGRRKQVKQIALGIFALSIVCLMLSFSRSAWIGALMAALSLFVLIYGRNVKQRLGRKMVYGAAGIALLAVLVMVPLRNTYFVRNVILHADQSTTVENPNQLRQRFWRESVEAAGENPLGYGPGTAGLASIRNDVQGVVLTENYYLQILYEVGVVGLLMFVAILAWVAWRLYQRRPDDVLVLALLAAFAGLAVTNFLVHIWSNEAVAYTWWGLAGLIVLADKKALDKPPKQQKLQSKK